MPDLPNIAAIVLAAGRSTRMGATNKLLAKFKGKTLLQHVLSNLQQSMISEIIVITGHEAEIVKNSINKFDVQCIENDQYNQGLSTSIKLGVENLTEHAEVVLICHGDMPFVSASIINQIITAYIDNAQIVLPVYLGQKGNPLLWPKRYFRNLIQLSGDVGAKQILKEYKDEVIHLDVDNVGILLDIDDSQTLEFVQSKFEKLTQ